MITASKQRGISNATRHRISKILLIIFFLIPPTLLATVTQAQQALQMPRIGAFHLGTTKSAAAPFEAFQHGLRELGYVEGKNITVEYRYGDGNEEKYAFVARELVAIKPAVIVTWGTDVAAVVKKTTRTIPIVALADRPDILGLVDNLARPSGNLTGLTTLNFELSTKRLELLKETIPSLSRVSVLAMFHPLVAITFKEIKAMARSLGIQIQLHEIKGAPDIARIFKQLTNDSAGTVLLLPGREVVFGPSAVTVAVQHRLPTMASQTAIADPGGLMTYGPRVSDMSKRAATYVDKILKGAKPGDLTIEQPTNLFRHQSESRQADRLDHSPERLSPSEQSDPMSVLARADKVIR